MARFDVYRAAKNRTFAIDVQANSMDKIETRVIVPLLQIAIAPPIVRRLNPVFEFDGVEYVFVAQYIATLPLKMLGSPVINLKSEADAITIALDMLFQGF
jgi:toxin CcdB